MRSREYWNRNLTYLVAVIALVLIMGVYLICEPVKNVVPPIEADTSTSTAHEGYVLAVHPYDTPSRLYRRYQPLCDYLGTQLGKPVRLYIAKSYEDQVRKITNGEVDFAYMGPTPYLRAHDHYGKQTPSRVEIIAGESPYTGVIIVRTDSSIHDIGDLREHTFAFGSPKSLASHYAARDLLSNSGLSLADLKDYDFLGRHERVVLAVLHGDYDAGATTRGIAELYMDREPGLRIIANTHPLPPLTIVARPDLDSEIYAAVQNALLNPGIDGYEAFLAIGSETTFERVKDSDFNTARAIVDRVERGAPSSGR